MIRLLLITSIALLLVSCERSRTDLLLVRPAAEIDAEIAESLVGLFDTKSPVRIQLTNQPMAGADAIRAVAEGQADIALISNDQPYREDIATVMPLYATVFHIVRTRERDVTTFAELLRDARVFAGPEGSAARRVLLRLSANIDLGDQHYRFVTDEITDIDLATVFAPISPDRLAEFPDVRLWSMGTPDQVGNGGHIDSIVLLNPHFRPFVIPAGTYGEATEEPIVTVAVDKIVVARADLDESVVYDLINEVLRLRPALGTIHPGLFQQVAENFDVSRSRFVVHSGTQAYLQRSEPSFIERYSGVAEVLVTLMIAAISATIAGIRIFNMRRKNRIDRFYSAAIAIRDRVSPDMGEEQRMEAAAEIQQLQDEAFALLVDEKLAANESFRIFMELCSAVLQQILDENK